MNFSCGKSGVKSAGNVHLNHERHFLLIRLVPGIHWIWTSHEQINHTEKSFFLD